MTDQPGGVSTGEVIAPGVGRLLSEARQAKELSVAQVAEKLKLSTRQVEALEAEDFSRLPSAVFVRGFIRNYARLLDISPDALLVDSRAVTEPTETITAPSEELRFGGSPLRRWLVLPFLAALLFLLLVALLYAWLSQGGETYVAHAPNAPGGEHAPTGVDVVPVLPPALPADPAVGATPPPTAPPQPAPVAPLAAPVEAPAGAPVATPAARPAPSVNAPGAPVAAASSTSAAAAGTAPVVDGRPPAGSVVQFSAREDAWIEVVSADNQRFTRLLRAGEQLALRGTPPFRLVVGNAANVQVAYRGKAVDLGPHIGDKVARVTLE